MKSEPPDPMSQQKAEEALANWIRTHPEAEDRDLARPFRFLILLVIGAALLIIYMLILLPGLGHRTPWLQL